MAPHWRDARFFRALPQRMTSRFLPDFEEDVDPVENDVGDLRGEPDVLQEVRRPRVVTQLGRVSAQLVRHEILQKSHLNMGFSAKTLYFDLQRSAEKILQGCVTCLWTWGGETRNLGKTV